MLKYNRIYLSECIDTTQNKLVSRECSLCHFYYFLDQNFKYQRYLCDGCHDISIKAMNLNYLAIVYSRDNAYGINFAFMTLNEAINLINSFNLVDKKGAI